MKLGDSWIGIFSALRFDVSIFKLSSRFGFPTHRLPSFRHPNLYGSSFCVDILDGSFGRSYESAGRGRTTAPDGIDWTP